MRPKLGFELDQVLHFDDKNRQSFLLQEANKGLQNKDKVLQVRNEMLNRAVPLQHSPLNSKMSRNIIDTQLQSNLTSAELDSKGLDMHSLQ